MDLLLHLILLLCSSKDENFVQGLVQDEAGFEGAVKVLSETVDGDFGVVVVEVPYLDLYGVPQKGLARLVVHRQAIEGGGKLPPFCHVHYEKDVEGARRWAEKGWVVTTAVYDEEHPIDAAVANGNNLARAIIQWVRRLPFVDRPHLHIDGGSQGGYMALAMSATFFPIAATTADAPVVNWAYNLNYLEVNKGISGYPDHLQESPLPVLGMVTMLADWSTRYFGEDLSSDTWYHLSPISYVERITNPVLITAATGDMLVPMEQMTSEGLYPFDPERFPEGYQRDFETLTLNPKSRRRFEALIPESDTFVHREPLQEHSFELSFELFQHPEKMPEKRPESLDRTWSPDHQWSLFYLDEGPPAPEAPHTTYFWVTAPDSFVAHYQKAIPAPGILNRTKLEHLMERYRLDLSDLPLLKEGTPANRLNFAHLERRDILQALLDYAAISERHEVRLMDLYADMDDKPLGDSLNLDHLQGQLAALVQAN